ncbi:uncharacterized protein LOC109852574 [Pseudomyrmex gracilis]|uniref:uncharacterized protein LOC109852574 n=1 Tax=Pseudomyrmex gracilis TaxID=219809 RepID=UPI0009957C59|nr:uncharacterized protein LOC109852574 [Pseudomyrmex gracilis]
MNSFILFLASIVLLQLVPARAELNEYLNEKLRQSKKELIKIHIRKTAPAEDKLYKLHWDRSWRVPVTSEYQPFTISTFDGIFVLDSNRVMAPSFNETSRNQTREPLRQIDKIRGSLSVKFVRSIVWKDSAYLLICHESVLCTLYTRMSQGSLRFRQTIKYRKIPVDATFFTQADQLYLVIVNNADKFSVPSVIYRWSGTYMDVVDEVMTIGATSVIAFAHRQSTIIVFAQSDDENPRVDSEVYEFKDNNIVKIQFLATARPTSMQHYVHGDFNFVLMINELGPSVVLCWDGQELLDWFSLREIEPHSLTSIFHTDGDTFVVVAHNNIIQLFKFHSTSDWTNEDTKRLGNEQKIVDLAVSVNNYTMSVILIVREKDTFFVEHWEAKITSIPRESTTKNGNNKCLLDLIEALHARMPAIREAEASHKFLFPFAKNITVPEPLKLDNLTLKSGTARSIEIAIKEDVLPPRQIEKTLDDLAPRIREIEAKTQLILKNKTEVIYQILDKMMQDTVTLGDVYLEELIIDQMKVYNVNDDTQQEKFVLGTNLTDPLDELIVRNLQVDSLCGIPRQYWTLRNNGEITLAIANSSVEYSNDTVIVHSDLTIPHLKIKSLNGTIVDELMNDLFIVNRSQKINGTITYVNTLQVTNLSTSTLNGVPADQIMTRTTNQSFGDFYIRILDIVNLEADAINGVPVEEAARKSRENIIKTPVRLANLCVTENLIVDANASQILTSDLRPLQIYKNVTLMGDLHLRNIRIGDAAALYVKGLPINVTDMFDNFWTKSGDQTITEEITFEEGVAIDKLDTKYLNGFEESDFLYTTAKEIPIEFTNLHFENLYVDEFFRESEPNVSFFQVETDLITIREKMYVEQLTATDIITVTFNGIDVDDIMNGNSATYAEITEIPAIRARQVFVDNLDVHLLNDREVLFENGLCVKDLLFVDILKTSEFHVQSLEVEQLNRIKMDLLTKVKDRLGIDMNDIVIEGDLTVKNLTVAQVNGQSSESFLHELTQHDIVTISEKNIDSLIVHNITLESLQGQKFDDLIASVLSKSTNQMIPGRFSARVVTSNNVAMNFINKKNASELMWVDTSFVLAGNVTFSDLIVEGDVITSKMNGRQVDELYESLLFVPAKNIDFLKVNGNLSWDVSSTNSAAVSYLLENAVTKDGDQVINGKVTFTEDVRAWAVTGSFNEINQIRSIISDAVIDNKGLVEIAGNKFFENDFVANSLTVNDNLGIANINDVNILEFNDSIVRKNREDAIVGPLIFHTDVTIEKLRVNDADFDASIRSAARSNDVMPDNIIFEDLTVLGDVCLERLNGINFTDFARNRVTLSGNHNVMCDLNFNGVVTVTGNANVKRINNILPSDFVLDKADKPQLINDVKTFEEVLVVDGDVTAPRINDVNLIEEHDDGVENDQDVEIFGDLIFKADVRVRSMNTSGLVNGMNIRSAVNDSRRALNETVQQLEEHWKTITKNMLYIERVSPTLPSVVVYLETNEELMIPGNNVSKVDVVYLRNTVRLNAYSEQSGKFCDLPDDDCPCFYETVIDLTDKDVRSWRRKPGEIVRNFPGVKLTSNTVSSSERCTSTRIEEFTTISSTEDISKYAFNKIEGYLNDAVTFTYDDDVYLILAMYYDKTHGTHQTNSLVYKLDSAAGNVTLIQEIPTDGAWSIRIFVIDSQLLLLIGCVGTSSQSLLFRFDPVTQKFEELRTFASRSRHVQSLSQENDHFVLLDNPQTNAVNIYKYNATSRNFDFYQGIFHVRPVTGIECFYTDKIGTSDMFAIVTTQGGRFYIYEYMFAGKFQMKLQHTVDGLQTMVTFYHTNRHYIFAGTSNKTTIFRIVKQLANN